MSAPITVGATHRATTHDDARPSDAGRRVHVELLDADAPSARATQVPDVLSGADAGQVRAKPSARSNYGLHRPGALVWAMQSCPMTCDAARRLQAPASPMVRRSLAQVLLAARQAPCSLPRQAASWLVSAPDSEAPEPVVASSSPDAQPRQAEAPRPDGQARTRQPASCWLGTVPSHARRAAKPPQDGHSQGLLPRRRGRWRLHWRGPSPSLCACC